MKEILCEFILNQGDIIYWKDLYGYFVSMFGDNFEEKFRTFYDCIDEDMYDLGYIFDDDELKYIRRKL